MLNKREDEIKTEYTSRLFTRILAISFFILLLSFYQIFVTKLNKYKSEALINEVTVNVMFAQYYSHEILLTTTLHLDTWAQLDQSNKRSLANSQALCSKKIDELISKLKLVNQIDKRSQVISYLEGIVPEAKTVNGICLQASKLHTNVLTQHKESEPNLGEFNY